MPYTAELIVVHVTAGTLVIAVLRWGGLCEAEEYANMHFRYVF